MSTPLILQNSCSFNGIIFQLYHYTEEYSSNSHLVNKWDILINNKLHFTALKVTLKVFIQYTSESLLKKKKQLSIILNKSHSVCQSIYGCHYSEDLSFIFWGNYANYIQPTYPELGRWFLSFSSSAIMARWSGASVTLGRWKLAAPSQRRS